MQMDKFKSRKFWFAFFGAILPIVSQGLTEEVSLEKALTLSLGVVISYILGQGYVDGKAVEGS